MSNFTRRLKYYGIGFGIGLLFVVFFFNNRGCSWTPSNRVKTAILNRAVVFPESQLTSLKEKEINKDNLIEFLEEAEIDFSASSKTDENKFYQLTRDKTTLFFTLTNESFISSVFTTRPKRKNWQEGKAKIIIFPAGDNLIFTDTTGSLQRTRTELGFKNDKKVFEQMKKECFIDYDRSDFVNSIKPEHYLEFIGQKGDTIGAKAVWYKEKININAYIYSPDNSRDTQ